MLFLENIPEYEATPHPAGAELLRTALSTWTHSKQLGGVTCGAAPITQG